MKRKYHPVDKPATPDGVGGFAWVLDNCFSSSSRNTSDAAEFGNQDSLPLCFLPT
ncbi:hypothetical protein SAMN04487948_1476 [Halogranum amylolyticum]|uniref:Uncharacterized protein n=1 Tax=Halogranum amylolyticum TaxID=660520 RepID=A0A1H8WVZ8_9EURY|nr:hypothetical protein SAMN04487948_1476 [Halogranum amylolyticum]